MDLSLETTLDNTPDIEEERICRVDILPGLDLRFRIAATKSAYGKRRVFIVPLDDTHGYGGVWVNYSRIRFEGK